MAGSNTFGGLSAQVAEDKLTKLFRMEALDIQGCAQLATPPTGEALGLQAGDTRTYTYVQNLDNTQGGELDENTPISTDGLTLIKRQYSVTEYGHGIAFTGKLEKLSELDMEDAHMKALSNHRKTLENKLSYDELVDTDWNFVFDSTTPSQYEFVKDGTPTKNTSVGDLTRKNLSKLTMEAKREKIPFWDGESYMYVTGARSIENLQVDDDVTDLLREDSGRAALNGEVGRIAQARIIEDNDQISDHPQSLDEGILAGADAVVREDALPWEIRFQDDDFRRSKEIAYYGILKYFKIMDQDDHSQEHIIHVTAAA